MGTILPESEITLATPKQQRSDFRARGKVDFSSGLPAREDFAVAQALFCERVRQELQTALRGRVPLGDIGQSVLRGAGFTRRVDAFAAEVWRAENPRTGERRLFFPSFEVSGSVLGNYGFYSSAADAVRKNWPELEAEIVGAAGKWFQENVALPSSATPSAGGEVAVAGTANFVSARSQRPEQPDAAGTAKWHNRSQRGILPAHMGRHLTRLEAISGGQSASDHPPETSVSPTDPVETLRFRTFTELAAWASNQAVTAERQR